MTKHYDLESWIIEPYFSCYALKSDTVFKSYNILINLSLKHYLHEISVVPK